MLRSWQLTFLGKLKVLQKGIQGLVRTHEVATADDMQVEAANSMRCL